MTRKEWFGFAVIVAVCAFFCGLYWFLSEGRFSGERAIPVSTATPFIAPASAHPFTVPATTSAALVTSVSQPVEIQAFIPQTSRAIWPMTSSGNVRVTFEIPAAQADKARAFQRGAQYVLSVRGMK